MEKIEAILEKAKLGQHNELWQEEQGQITKLLKEGTRADLRAFAKKNNIKIISEYYK